MKVTDTGREGQTGDSTHSGGTRTGGEPENRASQSRVLQNPSKLVHKESRGSVQEVRLGERWRDRQQGCQQPRFWPLAWFIKWRQHLTPAHPWWGSLLRATPKHVKEGGARASGGQGSLVLGLGLTVVSFWLSSDVLEPHLGLCTRIQGKEEGPGAEEESSGLRRGKRASELFSERLLLTMSATQFSAARCTRWEAPTFSSLPYYSQAQRGSQHRLKKCLLSVH